MRVTFEAEVVKDQDGAMLIRLDTGFGAPEIWVDKSRVEAGESKVAMATHSSWDPT